LASVLNGEIDNKSFEIATLANENDERNEGLVAFSDFLFSPS